MSVNQLPAPDGGVPSRVWFVTGTSSGLGRAIAEQALAVGDTVVATARKVESLAGLMALAPDRVTPLPLDVTDGNAIANAVQDAIMWHGRIDVLVNNAGHGFIGAAEETPDAELRDMLEVHLHGPVALTRAVLPHMRARRSGAIVQMSSMGGQVVWPGFAAYCTAKFALEGYSEGLAAEVASFGIKVLIPEPGAFRTGFAGAPLRFGAPLPDYRAVMDPVRALVRDMDGTQPGDPAKAAAAILAALDSDRTPLRLPLGPDAYEAITGRLAGLQDELTTWRPTSVATDVDQAP
ncbi:oxidoreductase [Saccharothrix violaceirubra]|uniref:NAD(P)-dependent dehydrogenase (Short-subunit alcohol dehydrogenase family) n=1 Tax=Saccharothrix violaceirubra TaxID=413306 RepID=A0A7W7SYR2_9PSEU|nr:oxidoreductase [Saccharothrix violaceirubra]MBB4963412.1 NAD(P)-dependent dehydrogenase (short-subunit alcohol dehydrogenase family) [Saccharothrix violaceirubra]